MVSPPLSSPPLLFSLFSFLPPTELQAQTQGKWLAVTLTQRESTEDLRWGFMGSIFTHWTVHLAARESDGVPGWGPIDLLGHGQLSDSHFPLIYVSGSKPCHGPESPSAPPREPALQPGGQGANQVPSWPRTTPGSLRSKSSGGICCRKTKQATAEIRTGGSSPAQGMRRQF